MDVDRRFAHRHVDHPGEFPRESDVWSSTGDTEPGLDPTIPPTCLLAFIHQTLLRVIDHGGQAVGVIRTDPEKFRDPASLNIF